MGVVRGEHWVILYEKKTVAFLKTVMLFSRKNQVDSQVFSLAPSYHLHPYSGMQFIPYIKSQCINLALMLFSAKRYALKNPYKKIRILD